MKRYLSLLLWITPALAIHAVESPALTNNDKTKTAQATSGFMWRSAVPKDSPFPRSPTLTGIYFTGRHSDYRCGDTFHPSWASDDNLYSPWTDGWPTVAKMTSYILEADQITGPRRMAAYLKDLGEQAYFLNFPSEFISADDRSLWLSYSANFSPGWNGVDLKIYPPGGRYGLCLHEVKLLGPAVKESLPPHSRSKQ
jgi:hypothetical protein